MKSPAFQLYAADFYMDTVSWSPEMVGVYTRLLFYQWVNGSIPDDLEAIARIGGCMADRNWRSNVARIWRELCHKFVTLPDGNLVNVRLEKSRTEKLAYIEKQRIKGKKRAAEMWEGHIAAAKKRLQPEDSSSSSSSSSNNNNNPPISPRKKRGEYEDGFLKFWTAYPKKMQKPNAYREWQKLGSRRPPLADLLACIERQGKWQQWRDGYIPYPERWLKNERWNDEEPPPTTGGNNGRSGKGNATAGIGIPKEYIPEPAPEVSAEARERVRSLTAGLAARWKTENPS